MRNRLPLLQVDGGSEFRGLGRRMPGARYRPVRVASQEPEMERMRGTGASFPARGIL